MTEHIVEPLEEFKRWHLKPSIHRRQWHDWHCWLGHQTCKNRRPYNLYCVGADVKPCSINQNLLATTWPPRGRVAMCCLLDTADTLTDHLLPTE